MRSTKVASLLLTLTLTAPSLPLYAADAPVETQAARDLLRAGVELRKEQKDREALDVFTRAYALAPTPTARAQMGLARAALGEWLAAEEDLRVALGAEDAWIQRNRADLEAVSARVAQHLAWLTVDVDVPGAQRIVDGHAFPEGRTRVLAGRALVKVQAAGYAAEERAIDVAGGADAHVAFSLARLAAPEAPPPAIAAPPLATHPLPPESTPSRALPFATGALGIVSIGVGTYFGVRALHDKSVKDASCSGTVCKDQAGVDADQDGRTSATVSTIAIGVGIALVGASVAWLVLSHPKPSAPATARGGSSPLLEITRW